MVVTIAVEGATDVSIAQRLLEHVGLTPGYVYNKGGKPGLKKKLHGYNASAFHSPWLVLCDLDHDADCAGALAREMLPEPAPQMCFRVAVREAEAWLLADAAKLASYLGVSRALVPSSPDALDDPKREIVNLARRSARRRTREDFVPEDGVSAIVGPGYAQGIMEFANKHWRPEVASASSPSLSRCISALRVLARDLAGGA